MSKIVGFIPAKGNSSRIKFKNKKRILGVPMFLWAANNLNRVLPKEHIYVDSDDDSILEIAKKAGFNTIKRPSFLASNDVDGNKLLEWEFSNVKNADILIQHLPPMIFCKKETICKGISKIRHGFDSVVYVHSEKHYLWGEGKPLYDTNKIPNSVDLEPIDIECMGLYVVSKESFERTKKRINKKYAVLEIDHFEKNDIDYEHDLIQARALASYFKKNKMTQYYEGVEFYLDENI